MFHNVPHGSVSFRQMLAFTGLVIAGLAGIGVPWGAQADDVPQPNSRPLDLPSGGGATQFDEDTPELISFFGRSFEANAFVWFLDLSSGPNNEAEILKVETMTAIQQLSSQSEFSIVASATASSGCSAGPTTPFQVWANLPKLATQQNKTSAIRWVDSLSPSGSLCMEEAAIRAVEISNRCKQENKRILVVAHGLPVCNGVDTTDRCLVGITTANWQVTPIDCIYVPGEEDAALFLTQLAYANRGRFLTVYRQD